MILNRLSNLSPRERLVATLAAVCVLAWIGDLVVVGPVSEQLGAMGARTRQAEQELAVVREVIQREAAVEAQFSEVQSVIPRPRSVPEAMDDMSVEVDQLVRKTAVDCPSMGPREPLEGESYDVYYVDIGRFEAETKNLLLFLDELRKSPSLLRVEKLSIDRADGAGKVTGTMLISKVLLPAAQE